MKTKIELITGFLGAGKTTFIKGYLEYLKKRKESVILVENEFGKAGVDAELLEEAGVDIFQLTGGCICCGQKVNFHDALIALSERYDRILIEPSGIYTLEDFYDICESPKVEECCEIHGIYTIVDLAQITELSEAGREVFYSQAAGAGVIIVSKLLPGTDCADEKQKAQACIAEIFSAYGNGRQILPEEVLAKPWKELTDADYAAIGQRGYVRNTVNLRKQDHSTLFQSTTITPVLATGEALEEYLKKLLSGTCGSVLRAKGYLTLVDGTCYEINCTPDSWQVAQSAFGRPAGLNVIGSQLDRRKMKELAASKCSSGK